MDIVTFMRENSSLFRYSGEYLKEAGDIKSILLVGEFGTLLSNFYRNIGFSGPLSSYDGKDCYDIALLYTDVEKVDEIKGPYSFISAPLYIQSLSVKELTRFLFSSYDALLDGGVLYISFPDAIAPNVKDKERVKSFYSDGDVYIKYYSLFDVINASEAIGFKVASIESDEAPFHDRVISLALKKNKKK